jgi:hypothetical protein
MSNPNVFNISVSGAGMILTGILEVLQRRKT